MNCLISIYNYNNNIMKYVACSKRLHMRACNKILSVY